MTGSQKSRTAAERVAAQLATWADLQSCRPSCGVGRGYGVRGGQVLHLHTGDEADLLLTRPLIARLDRLLTESGQVMTLPVDDWVTVRLDTDTEGSLLLTLLSLAIKATSGGPAGPCSWTQNPPRGRLRSLWRQPTRPV